MYLLRIFPFFFLMFLLVEGGTIARLDYEGVSSRVKRGGFLDLERDVIDAGSRVVGGTAGGIVGGFSGALKGIAGGSGFAQSGGFGSWGEQAIGGGAISGKNFGSSSAAGVNGYYESGLAQVSNDALEGSAAVAEPEQADLDRVFGDNSEVAISGKIGATGNTLAHAGHISTGSESSLIDRNHRENQRVVDRQHLSGQHQNVLDRHHLSGQNQQAIDRQHLSGQNQQVVGLPTRNVVHEGGLSSVSRGHGVVAPGILASGGGHAIKPVGGIVAGQTSNHLSADSEYGTLSAAGGRSQINAGQSSDVSLSKSSSSSSNKNTKIKSSSSFGGLASNLKLEGFGASNSENLAYDNSRSQFGANIGNGGHQTIHGQQNVGLNVAGQSNVEASRLDANALNISGTSNTEVDESESSSQTNSETFKVSNNSQVNAGSQFGAVDQTYGNQNVASDSSNAYVGF